MKSKSDKKRLPSWIALGCGLAMGGAALVALAQGSGESADKQKASGAVDLELRQELVSKLRSARPGLQVGDVRSAPIEGMYQIQLLNGPTVYMTEKGDHLIAGDLFQVTPGRLVNVTEQARGEERRQALAKLDKDNMIVFSPEGETKAHINVFTDVDCGYCRMLHQEVPELNRMGIEVRYLAYPRAGVGSDAYKKLATAWCADNPQETLTQLKSGKSMPFKVCEDNPVAEQYTLGQQLGVTATPALVLESGELQLGYLKANELAQRLGINPESASQQ